MPAACDKTFKLQVTNEAAVLIAWYPAGDEATVIKDCMQKMVTTGRLTYSLRQHFHYLITGISAVSR